jgi:hypothetical protein
VKSTAEINPEQRAAGLQEARDGNMEDSNENVATP